MISNYTIRFHVFTFSDVASNMEAINKRLQELEKTETDLYFQRQSTIQRRQRDDAEIRARRQEEDGVFFAQLTARDHEEDVSVSLPIYALGQCSP